MHRTSPEPAAAGPAKNPSLWQRLCRASITRRRISRRSLVRLCEETATSERTLVVHSVDIDYKRYFPDSFVISSRAGKPVDLHTEKSYAALRDVADESYRVIVCTGLLEHIPDPQALVEEFRRILQPGGRLIISASAVFPFHGSPDNYFHFTLHGFRHLFRAWSGFEILRGSSRPYESLAILLQRINLQCDLFPPMRLVNEALFHLLPLLDVFVLRQFDTMGDRHQAQPVDSIMPAMVHAVVIR